MLTAIGRRSFIATGLALPALAAPHIARAAPRIAKLGLSSADTSQFGQGCLAFAAAVANHPRLSAVFRIEVHGNAEFGDEGAMLDDVRLSTLDMAVCPSFSAVPFCPEIGLLDPPFVFQSVDRCRAAIDGSVGQDFATLLKGAGIQLIAWLENGVRHFTSNWPIRTPADLVGLKMRTPPAAISTECFRGLGADAKPLPFKETYEALRTGQFDAHENGIAAIEVGNICEVQKYLCLSSHAYSAGMIVASPDFVDEIPRELLNFVLECGRAGSERSRLVAANAGTEGIMRLRQKGMRIITDVDRAAFFEAAKVNLGMLEQRFGTDQVKRFTQAMN